MISDQVVEYPKNFPQLRLMVIASQTLSLYCVEDDPNVRAILLLRTFMKTNKRTGHAGFTLIELLVCIALIGVLAYLGLSSFWTYRSSAALSVAQQTLRNARTSVEAGINSDTLPPAISYTQTTQGRITDPDAGQYLPSMTVPKNVRLVADYDPTCDDGTCQSDSLEIRHCLGKQFVSWYRMGDGLGPNLPIVASGSFPCP